jgi:hypothetical protein
MVDARGDIEIAQPTEHGISFATTLQLEPGALVLRLTMAGLPSRVLDLIGAPSRARAGAATSAGFGVINVAPYLPAVPPPPIVAGVTAAQLARTIAGPATFSLPPGAFELGLRIPLGDPAPAAAVVAHCNELALLALAGATAKAGGCRVKLPQDGLEIDAWIEAVRLRIRRQDLRRQGRRRPRLRRRLGHLRAARHHRERRAQAHGGIYFRYRAEPSTS